jgi:hypothetical protein
MTGKLQDQQSANLLTCATLRYEYVQGRILRRRKTVVHIRFPNINICPLFGRDMVIYHKRDRLIPRLVLCAKLTTAQLINGQNEVDCRVGEIV